MADFLLDRNNAKKAGKATITAKVNGKRLKCVVTVVGKLNSSALDMNSFQQKRLRLSGATPKSWSSSDTTVAVVDGSGLVKAGGVEGVATISCTDTKGNTYSCEVSMTFPELTCEMSETQYRDVGSERYYFKYFEMYNGTGSVIWFTDENLYYYPYADDGDYTTEDYLIGMADADVLDSFEEEECYLESGRSGEFYGFEGTSYRYIYSGGEFMITINVNDGDYTCWFSTDGEMILCLPQ